MHCRPKCVDEKARVSFLRQRVTLKRQRERDVQELKKKIFRKSLASVCVSKGCLKLIRNFVKTFI